MNALTILALIMLTLVGYSSGMVLARGKKLIQPILMDLGLVALLWVGALSTRALLGRWWSILFWLVTGLLLSAVVTLIRRTNAPEGLPFSELPEHAKEADGQSGSTGLFRRLWQGWTHFAEEMGNVQGRLLMGFFYFIVVSPFGLGTRLFSDPLNIKERPINSAWLEKDPIDRTLEEAREQG
ncbi:MAG: hypothetical protein AAF633_13920 [Chloroflexota bacterium]